MGAKRKRSIVKDKYGFVEGEGPSKIAAELARRPMTKKEIDTFYSNNSRYGPKYKNMPKFKAVLNKNGFKLERSGSGSQMTYRIIEN
ncbi:MAG: hypothetical protein GDA49_01255 [Rhodospirillales bacterium]|nr:hypothetical protein [Rhodospirillales bacterium]